MSTLDKLLKFVVQNHGTDLPPHKYINIQAPNILTNTLNRSNWSELSGVGIQAIATNTSDSVDILGKVTNVLTYPMIGHGSDLVLFNLENNPKVYGDIYLHQQVINIHVRINYNYFFGQNSYDLYATIENVSGTPTVVSIDSIPMMEYVGAITIAIDPTPGTRTVYLTVPNDAGYYYFTWDAQILQFPI
jgi:hypothetical protein